MSAVPGVRRGSAKLDSWRETSGSPEARCQDCFLQSAELTDRLCARACARLGPFDPEAPGCSLQTQTALQTPLKSS
ncbi:hypothetical protein FQA47_024236 [Oryzias melastigma]|uniref:Uncharacterized protein n=1 Tax=Oryzias melastigma TaxID=30732 RepID=A0A834C1N6_ORYME|nr:hypothetical protein FQA47_024236 [Oryzias melastigma]